MGSYHETRENRKGARPKEAESASHLAAGVSDTGCERESNEDRFLVFTRNGLSGYFVFDGMGGQPAGEAAAQISSDVIRDALRAFNGEDDLLRFVCHVIEMAQEEVLVRSAEPGSEGMGTTVVGVLARNNELVVAAVGDSRAYHIKKRSVTQITNDHTLVQQLVDAGQISPHDALVHPQSHILTRCVGSTFDFSIDSQLYRLTRTELTKEVEEWLLLCSDGLYSLVSDEEMRAIVSNLKPQEAAQQLIDLARSRGGFDNITALVIPLAGRLVEVNPVTGLPTDEGLPDVPDDGSYRSTFTHRILEACRRPGSRRVGRVSLTLGALLILMSVIEFLLSMSR